MKPGIGKLSNIEYLRALQSMNRVILNRLFLFLFIGAIIAVALVPIFHFHMYPNKIFWLFICILLIYWAGVFGVTVFGNIPLNEILDKTISLKRTNRGGKITYHGPGQLICYFVIDLKKRNKDIRKFISLIEKTIIDTLATYNIQTFSDKKNIGIWYKEKSQIKKVAAIGVRVSKWIAYHGFSININNDLEKYKSIIPCGIKDKGITSLEKIYNQDYELIGDKIIKNFISNLNNLNA